MSFLSPRWCACLNEEFSLQAEKEAELGLPVQTPETVAEFKPRIFGFVWNLGPPWSPQIWWLIMVFPFFEDKFGVYAPLSDTEMSYFWWCIPIISPLHPVFPHLEHMNTPFSTFSWSKEHFSQRNPVLLRFQGHIFYVWLKRAAGRREVLHSKERHSMTFV